MGNVEFIENENTIKVIISGNANIQNINDIKDTFVKLKNKKQEIELDVSNDSEMDCTMFQLLVAFVKSINKNVTITTNSEKVFENAKILGFNRLNLKNKNNDSIKNIFLGGKL